MKKNIIILLLLLLPFISFGQKSFYSIFGVNYSNQQELFWVDGISIYNQFGINLKKRVSINTELKFSYAGANDIGSRNYISNIIDQQKDYAFGYYPGESLDNGLVTFKKTYSAKYIAFNLDMGVSFILLNKERHHIDFGLGLTFCYIDKMYTASSIDGDFFSVFYGEQQITIISPLYIRYLDLGYNVKLNYLYKFNDTLQVGVRGDMIYLTNSYFIIGVGPFVKLRIQ